MKVLAHEPIKVDVKYGAPVDVVSDYNVVLTNDFTLMQVDPTDSNLKARIKLIYLPRVMAKWCDITEREMEVLLLTVLWNLLRGMDYKRYSDFIHYGYCDVVWEDYRFDYI